MMNGSYITGLSFPVMEIWTKIKAYQSTICLSPNCVSYHAIAVDHYQHRAYVLYGQHRQIVQHLQAALHPLCLLVALRVFITGWNLILDQ